MKLYRFSVILMNIYSKLDIYTQPNIISAIVLSINSCLYPK